MVEVSYAFQIEEPLMLLCGVKGPFEGAPDATRDVALDAADRLTVGLAFARAPSDVVACRWVDALAGDGDEVERSIELAVASPAEPVACLVLPGCGFDRGDASEACERGFVAASARMGPGEVEGCCGDVADSWLCDVDPVSWTRGYGIFGSPWSWRHLSAYSAGVRCPRPAWWRCRL